MKKLVFIIVFIGICANIIYTMREKHPVVYDAVTNTTSRCVKWIGHTISTTDWKGYWNGTISWCGNACDKIASTTSKVNHKCKEICDKTDQKFNDVAKHTLIELGDTLKKDNDFNSTEIKDVPVVNTSNGETQLYKVKYHLVQNGYCNYVTTITSTKPQLTRIGNKWNLQYNFPNGSGYSIQTDHKIVIDDVISI